MSRRCQSVGRVGSILDLEPAQSRDAYQDNFTPAPGRPDPEPADSGLIVPIRSMLRSVFSLIPQAWKNRARAHYLRLAGRRKSRQPSFVGSAPGGTTQAVVSDCRLCGTPHCRHDVIGSVPLTQRGPFRCRSYRLIRCSRCDVVYLDPLPPPGDLKILYEDSSQFTAPHYSGDEQAARIPGSYARRLGALDLIPQAKESVLEVGAGRAWVSRVCKQRQPDIHTVAQDVSAECSRDCPWVDEYHVGSVQSVPRERDFDLISLTHVIEHVPDPRVLLAELAGRLATHGRLYVSAPFRPPLWRLREGIAPWLGYSYLHVPAHISYLSRTWFDATLPGLGLKLAHWDDSLDGHQAFDAIVCKAS